MQTPALLEAIFRFHDRRVAVEICSTAQWYQERVECLARFYPQGPSVAGMLLLKIAALTLLVGAVWGLVEYVKLLRDSAKNTGSGFTVFQVIGYTCSNMAARMWSVFKGFMAVMFMILLVQIVVL